MISGKPINYQREIISQEYGVLKVETHPSVEQTKYYISLISNQIKTQALTEIIRPCSTAMFHFGIRWGMLVPENIHILPMSPDSIIAINQYDERKRYAYSSKDQWGNDLPSIKNLKPIMEEIENHLGVNMADYDAMIGNIYLQGMYIPPHRDTTESLAAKDYPIIVYTIGNSSALGIWDENSNKIINKYNTKTFNAELAMPTNEILTNNGTIYTMGYMGRKRFELMHTTPCDLEKPIPFPEITLPDNKQIRPDLRAKKISRYTITLTFRRAKDIEERDTMLC